MIDSRAVVDTGAQIDEDVHIGAYALIGSQVKIGAGTRVGGHTIVQGRTTVGSGNAIHSFCSLGSDPQHVDYQGEDTELVIGDDNTIREYCSLNRGSAAGGGVTRVGSNNFIMAYVHLAHDCQVGNHTIFANGTSLAGHVHVGDYAVLGGFSLIHQFCRVGAHCITGIGTITFKDIPPFLVAAGNTAVPHGINAKGLRRRDFSPETIRALRQAYKTVYRAGLRLSEALVQIRRRCPDEPNVQHFVQFIESSERGIIR